MKASALKVENMGVNEANLDCNSATSCTSFHSRITSKSSRKLTLCLEDCDVENELRTEVERSRVSQTCNLSALQLQYVPSGLPLDTLTSLSLSENKLESLPDDLFAGKSGQNLKSIDINSNCLKNLPRSLFYLPRLEGLMVNQNCLSSLPIDPDGGSSGPLLPSLIRLGLEFNQLQTFPIEFFERCPMLREVLLSQNQSMLDAVVPFDRLVKCAAGRSCSAGNVKLLLRMDNRPRFMEQVIKEKWEKMLPWLKLEYHKIYPDQVLGFLFLGSLRTAQTVTVYRDLNIGYVLTVGRGLEVIVEPGMHHLEMPLDDYPEEDIQPLFAEAFDFINAARKAKKGVLIHCFAGISRSVTIAAAYIMKHEQMSADDALRLIRQARPAARPNDGFMKTLYKYEAALQSRTRSSKTKATQPDKA